MTSYLDIETRRKRIGGISRAAMCRRANVNESTVALGLKETRQPIPAVRDKLTLALDGFEAEKAALQAQRAEAAE